MFEQCTYRDLLELLCLEAYVWMLSRLPKQAFSIKPWLCSLGIEVRVKVVSKGKEVMNLPRVKGTKHYRLYSHECFKLTLNRKRAEI